MKNLALAIVCCIAAAGPATAADLTCRTISFIVPAGVGTGTDLVARDIADAANAADGKARFQVTNRPAAVAYDMVMKARGDGCTLLFDTQAMVANEAFGQAGVGWRSFRPLAMMTRTPLVIAVSIKPPPTPPPKEPPPKPDIEGVIAGLRDRPEALGFGLTADHFELLALLHVEEALGVRFRLQRYENGSARYAALIGGSLDLSFISIAAAHRRMRDGTVQALAVTAEAASPALEGVPPLHGPFAAVKPFGIDHGVYGPKGMTDDTAQAVVALLEKAINRRGALAALHKRYGTEVRFVSKDGFVRHLENVAADWKDLLGRVGERAKFGQRS